MNLGTIVAIIFFVVAFMSAMGVYVAIKSKNNTFRNISGIVCAVALLLAILIFFFTGASKQIEVNGVKEEYETDRFGNVTIKANLVNIDDYSKVTVSVFEGKKDVTDKNIVTTTLTPSKDQLSVRYTYAKETGKEQLITIKVNSNMQTVTNNSLMKASEDYITPDIQKEMITTEKEKLEKELIETEKNGNTNDKNLESISYGNRTYQKTDINEFNSRRTGTVDRANADIKDQLDIENMIKSVNLKENNSINVTVNNLYADCSKDDKEIINEIIGRRILGLQRGTLALNDGTPDIVIEVFAENEKLVAKSVTTEKVDMLEIME